MLKNFAITTDFSEQTAYTKRVRELALNIYGKQPKACVNTFGCQQNVSDSERLKGMLTSCGYEIVDEMENCPISPHEFPGKRC